MKIKATLIALTLSAFSVFGQGVVTFQNSTITAPIKDGNTLANMAAGGNTFSFYFVYGADAGSLNNTSATFFNDASAAGRITLTGTANLPLVNGFPGGTPAIFQLFAYSTSAGSYANALITPGAQHYTSPLTTITPSTSPTPGAAMFGTGVGTQFQGFTFAVTPVPEPTTIALGILGAGSLLFIRRKK